MPEPEPAPAPAAPPERRRMRPELKMTLLLTAAAIPLGLLSWATYSYIGVGTVVIALAGLWALAQVCQRWILRERRPWKWFMSNGGWIYLFVWFISWIVFYNLLSPL